MDIPNQNNIFKTIQSVIENLDSLAAKLITSTVAKKETVDAIVDATKNIKKSIGVISQSIVDVVRSLAELEEKNIMTMIDSSSIFALSSIKMIINSTKGDQFKGPALVIASYVKLIGLISELSKYAESINIKAISKSSKAVIATFKQVYKIQKYILKRAFIIEKLNSSEIINKFFESSVGIFGKINDTLLSVGTLIQTYESIGGRKARRKTRRAIKTIFSIYVDMVVGAVQLAQLLIFGKLSPSYIIPLSFKAKSLGPAGIFTGLELLMGLTKYFEILFKMLSPIMEQLNNAGQNRNNIKKGLRILYTTIYGNKLTPGIIDIFSNIDQSVKFQNLLSSVKIILTISILMSMMYVVTTSLKYIGENKKNIRRGIRGTEMILLGNKGVFGIGSQLSLIKILSSIDEKDVKNIINSIKPILLLTTISVMLNILTLNLAIIGKRRRYVKKGIKTIKLINRLIDVLADINNTIVSRKITTKTIWDVSKILLLITGLLALISVGLTIIGTNILGITLSIPALLMMRVVLWEIVWLSNYLNRKGKDIAKSSTIFGAVGRLLFKIAKVFLMFIAASLTLAVIGLATASMLAVITGMTIAILAILAISILPLKRISLSTITMIAIAASLYIMSLVFIKISESAQHMKFVSILAFIGAIVLFVGLFSLIGLASPLLILATVGAAAMTLVGLSLLLMIIPLMLISELDPSDLDNAETNATLIIQTSLNIMRQFMNAAGAEINGGKQPQTWVGRILTGTLGTAGALLEAVLSVAFVALTFATVTLLLLTAAELSLLDNITIDQTSIETNVDLVVGTALKVIEAICGRKNPTIEEVNGEKKGLFSTLFKGLGDVVRGIKNIADSILSFGFVAITLLSVGMVALIAKNLEYIEKVKINPEAITTKVDTVINTSNSLISHIKRSNLDKDDIRKARHIKDFMKQIEKTVKHMSKIGEMNNQGQFDKAVDSYVRFVDKINTVKLENLQTATNMFEKMAEFSKSISGNFEGLADAINDKIMPLLEQLNESLDKTNEHIENGAFSVPTVPVSTGASVSTGGAAPSGSTPVVPQKDYSRILGEIKQEITKVQKTLTDGSQRTNIETR